MYNVYFDNGPHSEGMEAARDSKDFWENPYSDKDSYESQFTAWLAGWCAATKIYKENK